MLLYQPKDKTRTNVSSWSLSPQEAHKMVREANVKRAAAEKQLREAQGKVCEAFLGLFDFILLESLFFFSCATPRLMSYKQK